MGCNNCKKNKGSNIFKDVNLHNKYQAGDKSNETGFFKALILLIKILLFILSSIICFIILPFFTTYILFKTIFLNEGIDVSNWLKNLGKLLIKKDKEYGEEVNPDKMSEAKIMDIDDITETD